ncbi:MAG TPA: NAD(P)/FAD-dependent oxidoreductase [Candidatus Babeliales bacterium]|nr:NAD(P)/FAD-dependent oxidoreductase [Candidatus Babeliales bacterium]
MSQKKAIIIGAGPAGLTAAYELIKRTNIKPIVLEKSEHLGGISRTVNYRGNRIDIGGHRFFSKSDRVMNWWAEILPLQALQAGQTNISYQNKSRSIFGNLSGPNPAIEDRVMLLRSRVSRIYFKRKFFSYPLQFNPETVRNLGLTSTVKIGASYMKSCAFPIRKEKNLEDFFINRFGTELYRTFFKSYTEKVWGLSCSQISPEWGAQRIKGLSVAKTIQHFAKQIIVPKKNDIAQKNTETSLIEQFLYPKFGPGQMWQEVADRVRAGGGEIRMGWQVSKLYKEDSLVSKVCAFDSHTGQEELFDTSHVFSTMPVKELVQSFQWQAPAEIKMLSDGLMYRDFITVGLLLKKLKIKEADGGLIKDNWIYIQEPDVFVGRLQIFNNWSPYMVADPSNVWVGLEYFCNEGDELWSKSESDLIALAIEEMYKMGFIDRADVLDATVLRVEKTYPAYFGTYNRFDHIKNYIDQFKNLFLVGRNGMHKYNNQDHSMLTAMQAVENIIAGSHEKENIWAVNTEQEYHESKRA